jgi:inorganic phosphate transporter, PiT family
VVIAVALAFDYTNGFHDAANAIATSVFTRALAPRTALLMDALPVDVDVHPGREHHRRRDDEGLVRPRRRGDTS